MSESVKCTYCGKWHATLYSSEMLLKTRCDPHGRRYRVCPDCSHELRKNLEIGKPKGLSDDE